MGDNSSIIRAAEEVFARRVALRAVVKRPVKPILQLIPGMFILDFLKRESEARRFTPYYMAPRELALDPARNRHLPDGDTDEARRIEDAADEWLKRERIHSEAVRSEFLALVDALTEHFVKLLEVEGTTYDELVEAAYRDAEAYDAYLNRLAEIEGRMDNAIVENAGAAEDVKQHLQEKRTAKAELREKDIAGLFSA